MNKKLRELRAKRAGLVEQARSILNAAETEKRELTGEEQQKYDTIFADQRTVGEQIQREERQIEMEREIAGHAGEEQRGNGREQEGRVSIFGARGSDEYRSAFGRMLELGRSNLSTDDLRALSAGAGAAGGFTLAPEDFVTQLIKAMDDMVFIRGLATVFPVTVSMGAPSLDADPADADWTAEVATGNEDSTMAFGKRELSPHPLAKRIKVSNKLLQASALPIEQIVLARLAYKFGISCEKAYLTGSGNNQPLGIFTASNLGIPTSRDVATGNAATAMTMDGLLAAKYALKGQYRRNAKWLFHRDGVKQIAGLKDLEGQYLWQPSKKDGEPDMLMGIPLLESEYAPNTFTTGQYVGALADFSHYWIADSINFGVQRLNELYAEANQTGFIGRLESDGMPALGEAFVRVKLG